MFRSNRDAQTRLVLGRRSVFGYDLVVLCGLYAAAFFFADGRLRPLVAHIPDPALFAAWAGALGAVAMSLRGVYSFHTAGTSHGTTRGLWTNEMLYWHFGKPFSGTLVGVAVFILLKAAVPNGEPSTFTTAAAAFVLGMQDHEFFNFVKRVGEVIIAVPGPKPDKNVPPGAHDAAVKTAPPSDPAGR